MFTFSMTAQVPDASKTVDSYVTDGVETNPFNQSHFDRLREQGIVKSSTPSTAAATPDAPRTADTDGAETNAFNESHFHRLQEQGVIKSEPFRQDARGDAPLARLGIHQLELEQAPHLRVIFQEYEGDTKVTLTAETTEQIRLPVDAPGTPHANILGAMHSRAEIAWSCKANHIKVTMFPIPCKDDILLYNEAISTLFLESVPNGLDVFEIRPKNFAVVYPGFWQLCDRETTVQFLLRPRRYRLLLKVDATKRTAEQPLLPSKRSKHSTGAAMIGHGIAESPSTLAQAQDQDQKTLIRPTVVDVNMLTSIGLVQNQTLNMVDGATGQLEYSIQCIDRYLKKGDYANVFKAVWKDGSSQDSPPTVVAVKLHKIAAAAEPYDIAAAAGRWKRELEAHRHLEHVRFASTVDTNSSILRYLYLGRYVNYNQLTKFNSRALPTFWPSTPASWL